MARVEIISENELPTGWRYAAQVLHDDGSLTRHEISLSWADYNLWSRDGSDEPSRVAEAVLMFMAMNTGVTLPAKFDASLARRLFPDADDRIPAFIS